MSEAGPTELRIYCLCGQKMKITSSMFGKPGKCVACRQKIRVPSESEIPADVTILYLKDHPELLRAPKRDVIAMPDPVSDAVSDVEGDDVLILDDGPELAPVPFVLYEPIGKLCNYEYKVNAQLAALRDGKPSELDKATLMSYRGLARKARQHLEKKIREELTTVSAQLQEIRDALLDEQVSLRSGVLDYVAYSKQVLPHRRRREALHYRQQNLRGWLATEDPHMAGGLVDVPLSDVPVESSDAPFPLAREIDSLPIEHAVLKLEEALRQREKSDRRLNELHRMNLDGALSAEDLKRLRADTDAERERSRTAVAFYRTRLEAVVQDCEEDSSAIQAHLDSKRRQLETGTLTKAAYEVLEESSFRAQIDIKRARNLATRAMNANTVSDVPNPRGTFLERLARPGIQRGLGVDSWLAWLGSALLLAVIFVPLGQDVPGGNAAVFPVLTLALFVGAAAFGLSATIASRVARALTLGGLWLVLTAAASAYLQYETNAIGIAGATLRSADPWWASMGGRLLLGGWGIAGLAVVVSFFPLPGLRWCGPGILMLGAAIATLAMTDYAGALYADPVIGPVDTVAQVKTGAYDVSVQVTNGGNRPFWIGGDRVAVPLPTTVVLQRESADGAWLEAGAPAAAMVDGAQVALADQRGLAVPASGGIALQYHLPPGSYRVQISPQWGDRAPRSQRFELAPFAVNLEEFFNRDVPETGSTPPKGSGVTVELRGVLDGLESQPTFSLIVTMPDGTVRREQFKLGDKLVGEWRISEFSPAHNTITLSDGKRLLIVERGSPEEIPE